jgi:hypothetical protein
MIPSTTCHFDREGLDFMDPKEDPGIIISDAVRQDDPPPGILPYLHEADRYTILCDGAWIVPEPKRPGLFVLVTYQEETDRFVVFRDGRIDRG